MAAEAVNISSKGASCCSTVTFVVVVVGSQLLLRLRSDRPMEAAAAFIGALDNNDVDVRLRPKGVVGEGDVVLIVLLDV